MPDATPISALDMPAGDYAIVELWLTIETFPSYEVSNLGRVRRTKNARGGTVGLILKPSFNTRTNYAYVMLYGENGRRNIKVSRLVCEAFHGAPPSIKHEAAHENGVRTDDRSGNLRWKTKIENEADKLTHGTRMRGERVNGAKLSDAQVDEIRALGASMPTSDIADRFDVSVTHVRRIIRRETRAEPTVDRMRAEAL